MKYFITGATGFIGGRIARQLVEAGHQVTALARDPDKAKPLADVGVSLVRGDIVDKESMRPGMAGVDGVFHIAAWYKLGVKDKHMAETINVQGTRNVLELMRELGVKKGVYTSTLAVFSDTRGQLADETYRYSGPHLSEYDRTKWLAHYEVAEPMIRAGLPLVIVMPGAVYGPGDTSSLGEAFRQYLTGQLPLLPQKTMLCWSHVDDVARGHILAMEKGRPGASYIIAGPPYTFEHVFETAQAITGIPAPRLRVPPMWMQAAVKIMEQVEDAITLPPTYSAEGLRIVAGTTYIASNEKARRELGYTVRPLQEGLADTLNGMMQELGIAPSTRVLLENKRMNILVYGAGPLGSLFAARLHQAGHAVSILAHGQRLAELREYGIVLEDVKTDQQTSARVNVVEQLAPDDAYDLVLVIMRKNKVSEILPALAANQRTPDVLFLMNNAAGPQELVEALGKERVLLGFPMSGGYRKGHVIRCLAGSAERIVAIPIGEVDGSITGRTRQVASVLASMPGYTVELRTDMDAWLKTHVALLMPSIAAALYAAGTDNERLARTRDLVVLAVRAVREGFQVLRALNVPIVPERLRIFEWMPEPLVVAFVQRLVARPEMQVALVGHANAARDEVKHLADEFMALARSTHVPTPAIDRLYQHLDPATPLTPEGSRDIPLDWRGVWLGLGALAGLMAAIAWIARRKGK